MNITKDNFDNAIGVMMASRGVKHRKELSSMIDVKETTLGMAINKKSLRLVQFLEIADKLGFDVHIKKRE